mmetsp:Transcript_11409/g.53011  ORF Transcript_11409/g.53011 Transcript_11409/m.53011 type:complete len:203 (+) Transcript_11409:795-1403(+)
MRRPRRRHRVAHGDEPSRAVVPKPGRTHPDTSRRHPERMRRRRARPENRRIGTRAERHARERRAVPGGRVRPDHMRRPVLGRRDFAEEPADLVRVATGVRHGVTPTAAANRAEGRRAAQGWRVHGVQHVLVQPGGERGCGGGAGAEVRRGARNRRRVRPSRRLEAQAGDETLARGDHGGRYDRGVPHVRGLAEGRRVDRPPT